MSTRVFDIKKTGEQKGMPVYSFYENNVFICDEMFSKPRDAPQCPISSLSFTYRACGRNSSVGGVTKSSLDTMCKSLIGEDGNSKLNGVKLDGDVCRIMCGLPAAKQICTTERVCRGCDSFKEDCSRAIRTPGRGDDGEICVEKVVCKNDAKK